MPGGVAARPTVRTSVLPEYSAQYGCCTARSANLDFASLHLGRGHPPYACAEFQVCMHTCTQTWNSAQAHCFLPPRKKEARKKYTFLQAPCVFRFYIKSGIKAYRQSPCFQNGILCHGNQTASCHANVSNDSMPCKDTAKRKTGKIRMYFFLLRTTQTNGPPPRFIESSLLFRKKKSNHPHTSFPFHPGIRARPFRLSPLP